MSESCAILQIEKVCNLDIYIVVVGLCRLCSLCQSESASVSLQVVLHCIYIIL